MREGDGHNTTNARRSLSELDRKAAEDKHNAERDILQLLSTPQ
jgi:hypothetical protein